MLEHQNVANMESLVPEFLSVFSYSTSQISDIEEATRNQSSDSKWHEFRFGMLTASNAKVYCDKIMSVQCNTNRTDCIYLINKCMSQSNKLMHVPAIKWGRDHEIDAVRKICLCFTAKSSNFDCEKAGLRIHKRYPYLGASPDGLILCDCCPLRVLECKCPYSIKDKDPTHLDVVTNIDYIQVSDGIPHLRKSHYYYALVQMQRAILNASLCEFIIWTEKNILILKVPFDSDYWKQMQSNLTLFFSQHLCKAVLESV